MRRLTWGGTAESVFREAEFLGANGDREQDWQPYPVDPYYCYIYVTIHTYNTYYVLRTYTHSEKETNNETDRLS